MKTVTSVLLSAFLLSATAVAGPITIEQRRKEIREWVISHSEFAVPSIAPAGNDRAASLVDRLEFENLAKMEEAGLLKAELAISPWSDFYWPTYAGQLANRYADPDYNSALNWKSNAEYLTKMLGRGSQEHFSPAEKYDLLLGDTKFTLSKKMINAGAPYANEAGEVEAWFGLCHGWAPASFMLSRPVKAVTVKSLDGRKIEFTPSDIKALATLLWAGGASRTRFIGGRCNDKEPGRDDSERETNPDCFDTNPATWHIAAVNQIAVSKRSFVMDASAGYEVWNQPIYGYEYAYMHPVTRKTSRSLADAKIRLADYPNDPFRGKRSPEAESVVKIIMTLDYIAENMPSPETKDGPDRDNHTVVNYSYDLELDKDNNIVGGEWHSSIHPDFLWVPVPGGKARSDGDYWLDQQGNKDEWKKGEAVPASWKNAARLSAVREQPLARVVERLIELAQ